MIPKLFSHQTILSIYTKSLRQQSHVFKCFSTQVNTETPKQVNTETPKQESKVRLNKLIALNSHYSRREATKLITERKVTVAGKRITTPYESYDIKELENALKVNGKLLPIKQAENKNCKVWIAHKLKGEIVTHNDPTERASLIDRLIKGGLKKHSNVHFKAIGRLDMNTEGLILLTDNGVYKQEMELPRNQLHRKYRVRVHGNVTDDKLKSMRRGVEFNGVQYKGVKVEVSKSKEKGGKKSANTWLNITCVEGKNRLVRNILKCLGLQVTRLIRISYGDYFLNTIPPGLAVQVPLIKLEKHKNRGSFHKKGGKPNNKMKSDKNDLSVKNNAPKPVQWIKAV